MKISKFLKLISICLVAVMVFTFASCKKETAEHSFVKITMESGAAFVIELYPEYAPETVENFLSLVKSGFYDGLTFHRIIEDFMAQGGDPSGDGTGGSDHNIKGEFRENGFTDNTLSHDRGVVSMARSNDPNSASSQFFICYSGNHKASLDGKYAAFGRVVEGMEVVDAFLEVERDWSASDNAFSRPSEPIVMKKAEIINYTKGEVSKNNEKIVSEMNENKNETTSEESTTDESVSSEHSFAKFTMKNGGSFIIELYPEYAPETVENFISLVDSGFYNGLTFHRIIEDFMAQGGPPSGDSTGGSEKKIKGEFATNGFTQNTLSHDRGVVSMARTGDPNSASCQFFICYSGNYKVSLDGNYAAFGKVIEGMEVVDGFLEVERDFSASDNDYSIPVEPIVIESAEIIEYNK